jgi:putative ABC transport system permease protein
VSTLWRKAFRDIWHERARAALVIAAMALGIAAFSAVMSSYAILERELNTGYLRTNPASATLRTGPIDDELVKAVAAHPGVAAVEARRVVSGRIKAGPAQWRTLMLFIVKDYADIRIGTLMSEAGAWPPGKGELLIERDAFQVAKAKIGDSVTVKLPKGDFQTLRVAGRVHDVGQAQARMENIVYGYATLETLALLGEEPYLDQLKILVSGDAMSKARVTEVAAEVKALVEARGTTVRRVEIPDPGKHPHADLMGLLLLAISTFGLLVLALSGVLVVNFLTSLMASQVRQIGMMKAVGGTTRQIARIYFAQAFLMGVAAVLVATPVGMLGARLLCSYLAIFLNFDMTSFSVPFWVYALVALVGLVTPLLAATRPVMKGSSLSVWAALADIGVSDRNFGADWLDRALTGVSGFARPLLLAIRNSFRRRTRLALTLLTLSVAGVFFMSALNVRTSMIDTIDHLFASKRFDVSINLAGMQPIDRVQAAIATAPHVVATEGWISTEATLGSTPAAVAPVTTPHAGGAAAALHGTQGPERSPAARPFAVLGLDPHTKLLRLEISEGRDLRPDDTDALVANSALVNRYPEIKVGETVVLRMGPSEASWRVVGLSREAFSAPVAYISRNFFERAGGHVGLANTVRVALDRSDAATIDAFRDGLDRNLEAAGMRAMSSTSNTESRYGFDQHMLMIYIFQIVMSVIIGAVGGLGLMTTMSLNVLERRREMGVLRAIGASSRAVWLIVVTEGLVIGLMSFVIAALLAAPLSRGIGDFLSTAMFQSRLNFSFDLNGLWIWGLVSLALSALASFLPAWNASRSSVREALGFE